MNYSEKLSELFLKINIGSINDIKSHHHIYADYVELVALVFNDVVSKSEILDRLDDNGFRFEIEDKTLDGETGSLDAEIDDKGRGWIDLIFEVIKERVSLFNSKYPFILSIHGLKLKDNLDHFHKQYIYLLICSSLRFFKIVQDVITTEFEVISEVVLRNYLPQNAIVHPFGNNSKFKGNARTKIKQLGIEMKIHLTDIKEREIEQIPLQSSKEEGLDLIGWIPFSDGIPNQFVIMVQCACGKPWFGKRFETSRYENFYSFYKQPPIHSMFIPYSLYKSDGIFRLSKNIVTPTLIFDRFRLMEYLFDYNIGNLQSSQIVEKCIIYEEDIV